MVNATVRSNAGVRVRIRRVITEMSAEAVTAVPANNQHAAVVEELQADARRRA